MNEQSFDVVVVGGGPTGSTIAAQVASHGLSAVIIEQELYGGECHYFGCIPSKALLRPVNAAHAATLLPGVPTGAVDAGAVLLRRDAFINDLDDTPVLKEVTDGGVAAVRGTARVTGERQLDVLHGDGATTTITARHAVVFASGSRAFVPDTPGLRAIAPWTNREVTTMKEVPRRLLVLGGGAIAVEMATAAKALGSEEVTLLVRGERLIPAMEPFAGELVLASLRESGVDVRLQTSAVAFERDDAGVTAQLEGGASVSADEVLVATGREARTDDAGLDQFGVGPGFIEVDDSMQVPGVPWLYVCGDANGRDQLTHMGMYQARVAGDVIYARSQGQPDDHPTMRATGPTPQVIFTDPQACAVGLTEAMARAQGIDAKVVAVELGSVPGAALLADGYTGRACLVLDAARSVVVGATFVGQDVAELLHSATVAVAGQLTVDVLAHAVPSFPTISGAWVSLLAASLPA